MASVEFSLRSDCLVCHKLEISQRNKVSSYVSRSVSVLRLKLKRRNSECLILAFHSVRTLKSRG